MTRNSVARPLRNVSYGLQLLRNRKVLWQMMREVFRGHYRLSWLTTIVVVLCIAYALFPFDVIPDFIPILGWLDDGLLLYLALRQLGRETMRYNRHKAMERKHG